jgi:hypothetical protein
MLGNKAMRLGRGIAGRMVPGGSNALRRIIFAIGD